MTVDPETSPAADIAYMRQLAEEGARAPMRGASILIAAGVLYGLASVAHWSWAAGVAPIPAAAINWLWVGTTVVFLAIVAWVSTRLNAGGVTTTAGRGLGAAWSSVGMAIFFMFGSLIAAATRIEGLDARAISAMVPSVILIFYGIGWGVTGAMMRKPWLRWLAVASFLAAPLVALLAGQPSQYLGYAAALFLLMAVPGWMLLREARRA